MKATFGNAYSEGFKAYCMAFQISFTLFCPSILRELRVPGHEQCRSLLLRKRTFCLYTKAASNHPDVGHWDAPAQVGSTIV